MRVALLVLVLSCVLAAHGAEGPAPAGDVQGDGAVRVSLRPELLRRAEVRKHLMSGLTANFVVSIARREQFGRIEVRYEPWDEVFFVAAVSYDGRGERTVLRSMADLEKWWSAPRLVIGNGSRAGERVRLLVEVIPFSAAEEADAKKWIARSIGGNAPPSPAGGSAVPEAPSLFSAVVGSSIRRKPVLRYAWDVVLRQAPR